MQILIGGQDFFCQKSRTRDSHLNRSLVFQRSFACCFDTLARIWVSRMAHSHSKLWKYVWIPSYSECNVTNTYWVSLIKLSDTEGKKTRHLPLWVGLWQILLSWRWLRHIDGHWLHLVMMMMVMNHFFSDKFNPFWFPSFYFLSSSSLSSLPTALHERREDRKSLISFKNRAYSTRM
jgi:hypothetical protein